MSHIEELFSDKEDDYPPSSSKVYLGFVDTEIKELDDITIKDTFIGDNPVWLHPDSIPEENLLKCGSCKSARNMKLLLQAYAPLDPDQVNEICDEKKIELGPNANISLYDDRVLYIFLCVKCYRKGNSVRCIRGVKKNSLTDILSLDNKIDNIPSKDFQIALNDLKIKSDSSCNVSSNIFTKKSDINPFAESNPFEVKKEFSEAKLKPQKINIKDVEKVHEIKNKKTDDNTAFPGYFLYVEEESFKNKIPDHMKLPKNLKIDKTALDLSGDSDFSEKQSIKLDPRTEKLSKFLDDDVFQKFQEIVGYNPLQVLRYDLGGKPLYYTRTIKKLELLIPAPTYNPSSIRIFEMQLMPKMIIDLEETVSFDQGMDWGTIMIFTDISNYIPTFDQNGVGYVEEIVKVQWESMK